MKETFAIRGFNLCESLLRHTPEQLQCFIRRMKHLQFNTIIIHYDYGWRRYKDLILEECSRAGVEITLMTFGPRTFFRYTDWKPEFLARRTDGRFFTEKLECETFPCRFAPGALDAFEEGARAWLAELPAAIRRVHMRAADGRNFCQCPRCRKLVPEERWNPFVGRFVKAVRETRPELDFETDVYIRRYDLPEDPAPFEAMTRIMFDTFPRTPTFPLGSTLDTASAGGFRRNYGTGNEPEEMTANTATLMKLTEWNQAFPGRVYIHENVMRQGYCGNFQYGTLSYLDDLKTLRDLGVPGICFEAYEPGYGAFDELFGLLAKAMRGEDVSYIPCELDKIVREEKMSWFCQDPNLPLHRYIGDPVLLKNQQFYQKSPVAQSPQFFRDYVAFALENEESLDALYIGYRQARAHLLAGKITFRNLSPEAKKMLDSRKLWDFMEDIPDNDDPRAVCRTILEELLRKAE